MVPHGLPPIPTDRLRLESGYRFEQLWFSSNLIGPRCATPLDYLRGTTIHHLALFALGHPAIFTRPQGYLLLRLHTRINQVKTTRLLADGAKQLQTCQEALWFN